MWHQSGVGAGLMMHGPDIQPGRYMENPKTKRRFRNLLETSGLLKQLKPIEPRSATIDEILSAHAEAYVRRIKKLSDAQGGEAGKPVPIGKGDY